MVLFDCPCCGSRLHALGGISVLECGVCTTWVTAQPVPDDEVCNAPFPDSPDTRCQRRPHVEDEHDPEHRGVNSINGAMVTWRSSEYGPPS